MSAPDISCFDYVIGLYPGECECYGEPPIDAGDTNSGLFISGLIELSTLNALLNCSQGQSIWDIMTNSRDEAIRRFIADTNALLMGNHRLKRQPFYGGIGRASWKQNLSLTPGHYYGVRMYCSDIVSGYLKIKKIGACFNQTTTFNLFIYNNLNELIDTISIDTQANAHKLNVVDIELPLHDNYIDNLEYYFVYQAGSAMPKNNDIKCACGGFKPVFDINRPYYMSPRPAQYGWANYMMVGGVNLSSISDFMDLSPSGSNYMNGLTFEIEVGCKVSEVYCMDALDFDRNTLAMAMAIAIQHKAAALSIDKIINSPNLNREVLINTEDWKAQKESYNGTYNEMVNYISSNLDISTNDCFECRDIVGMIKVGIMA